MAQIDHKHPRMTIYVARHSPITHWILLVLAEKKIEPNVVFVDAKNTPAEFDRINPKGILPFLVDQGGLVVYIPAIIAEYLEERFPDPPLLSIYPQVRAECRQVIHQVGLSWYGLLQQIQTDPKSSHAVNLLKQALLSFGYLLKFKPFLEEAPLVDCCSAPVLWKLKKLDINVAQKISIVDTYQKRLFEKDTFKSSLLSLEQAYVNF